jgi:AraC family transcriptional regulator
MSNRIVEMPVLNLVGLRGQFTPQSMSDIQGLWTKFISRLKEVPKRKGWVTYGACRANPDKTLEYTAAIEVDEPGPVPDDFTAFTIGGGFFALFTHTGHIRDIGQTWTSIHDVWMKEEGYIHRDAHDFEVYDERWNPKTGEGEVDIYIAVEAARR